MKLTITLLAVLGLAASQALAVTTDFTRSSGSSTTNGSLAFGTVSASAQWSSSGGDPWSSTTLGWYTNGLGVTNPNENGSGNTHTVDNVNGYDRIVLDFGQSVILDTVTLIKYDLSSTSGTTYDTDISVFYYSGSSWSLLSPTTNWTTTSNNDRIADINSASVAATKWAIAAGNPADEADAFKVSAATWSAVPPPPSVPDSGSTLLFLATGMALLFLANRKPAVA